MSKASSRCIVYLMVYANNTPWINHFWDLWALLAVKKFNLVTLNWWFKEGHIKHWKRGREKEKCGVLKITNLPWISNEVKCPLVSPCMLCLFMPNKTKKSLLQDPKPGPVNLWLLQSNNAFYIQYLITVIFTPHRALESIHFNSLYGKELCSL